VNTLVNTVWFLFPQGISSLISLSLAIWPSNLESTSVPKLLGNIISVTGFVSSPLWWRIWFCPRLINEIMFQQNSVIQGNIADQVILLINHTLLFLFHHLISRNFDFCNYFALLNKLANTSTVRAKWRLHLICDCYIECMFFPFCKQMFYCLAHISKYISTIWYCPNFLEGNATGSSLGEFWLA